jgi:hypothetical protein
MSVRHRLRRLEARVPAGLMRWTPKGRSAWLRRVLADCHADPFPDVPDEREYLAAVAAWNKPPHGTIDTDPVDPDIYRLLRHVTALES